jgi:hypothetical protein
MTLIACTFSTETPMIMGDVLISGDYERKLNLPVFPFKDISKEVKCANGRHPIDFLQKIYVISNTTTIAFAGNVFEMKNLYEDFIMYDRYHGNLLTDDHIVSFLNSYDMNGFKNSACLIMNVTEDLAGIQMLKWIRIGQWKGDYSSDFKDMFIVGSGEKQFLEHIMVKTFFRSNDPAAGLGNGIIRNICAIAQFLTLEWLSLITVNNLWGAAYELIIFADGAFKKLDDIAFVISNSAYEQGDNSGIPNPVIILYQKYYGDRMF